MADVLVGAGVTLVMAGAFLLLARSQGRKLYLWPVVLLAMVALLVVAWRSYDATYARFIEADVSTSGLRLRFAGANVKDVTIYPGAIDSVSFGLPGKSDRQCYIRVLLKNGDSYRSSVIDQKPADCKKLRQEIVQALAG